MAGKFRSGWGGVQMVKTRSAPLDSGSDTMSADGAAAAASFVALEKARRWIVAAVMSFVVLEKAALRFLALAFPSPGHL